MINPLDHPICLAQPLSPTVSAWVEHVPFGMFMIDILRPKVIVELGTNRGCSYLAFCQVVQQLGLNTRCYAVDTWKGDAHTGAYGENVLENLHAYHDPLYGEFSRLVQSTFDDTLQYFPDGSIDLLHIDGFHTYEAVKHDFESWLPKLSKHAVVLFHDTNVQERDFGVWKLWAELQLKYPHFEFFHGYGLGVLRMESEPDSALEALFLMTDEQSERLRTFFCTLGSRLSTAARIADQERMITTLTAQNTAKEQRIKKLTVQQSEKETTINALTAKGKENDQMIEILTAEKSRQEVVINETMVQKTVLENQINNMLNSKTWKLGIVLRKIRFWLMPVNSQQERWARFLYKAVTNSKR